MKKLVTLLVLSITLLLMLVLPNSIQGQNTSNNSPTIETFSDSRTLYRTAGSKKCRRATIQIEPNKITVYRRRGWNKRKLELAASFESGKVESNLRKFHRSNAALMTLTIGNSILSGLMILATTQEGTIITGSDGVSRRVEGVSIKKALIWSGAIGGLATIIGLTKSKRPCAQITDGMRNIELQVHKREGLRFEAALETFRVNSNRNPK